MPHAYRSRHPGHVTRGENALPLCAVKLKAVPGGRDDTCDTACAEDGNENKTIKNKGKKKKTGKREKKNE